MARWRSKVRVAACGVAVAAVALVSVAGCYGGRNTVEGADGSAAADGGDGDGGPLGEPGERLDVRVWRLSPTQFRTEVIALLGEGIPAGTLPAGELTEIMV